MKRTVTPTQAGGPHAVVAAHGLQVRLPARWEARLYRRDAFVEEEQGESNNPVLHLANFALPAGRGDFGTGAVEVMGAGHAFVSLLEYDADEAGQPLFAAVGLPRLSVADFAANALQRRRPGQLGCQRFFSVAGRPFCLYVVLGSRAQAERLIAEVQAVLDNLVIDREVRG